MRLTFLDGFDEAILGLVEQYGMAQPVVLYDGAKVIELLVTLHGLTQKQAAEHFDKYLAGMWLGEDTPAFAVLL